jgi:large subunit ribosomal protein L4
MAMPKSARRAALRAAIGARYGEGKLLVVDQIAVPDGKTRNLVGVLKGLGVEGSALIVVAGENPDVQRAGRNLPKVKVLLAGGLNVRDVLGHQTLLVTRDAIQAIAGRLVRKPVAGGAA